MSNVLAWNSERMLIAAVAMIGAVLLSLPLAFIHLRTKPANEFDSSVLFSIVFLAATIAGMIVVVQGSIARALSLAGVVSAVRFRSSLKDSNDAVYLLGAIAVGLIRRRAPEARPYFERRFDDRETNEIRLKLWGGDDRVTVRGDGDPHLKIRVIGSDGTDEFVDSTRTGGIAFYDDSGKTTITGLHGSDLNTKPFTEWIGSDSSSRYPPQEWGTLVAPYAAPAIEAIVSRVTGVSYADWFSRYITGSEPLPARACGLSANP